MTETTTTEIAHVHPAQLSEWLLQQSKLSSDDSHHSTPVILDVREPWELERASVKLENYAVVAIPMMQLQARMAELNRRAPVAVLCHHGVRSLQVARFLAFNGFSVVANISGGIDAWANEFDASVAQY
jgi:rhodanese-related sulfurtransferase